MKINIKTITNVIMLTDKNKQRTRFLPRNELKKKMIFFKIKKKIFIKKNKDKDKQRMRILPWNKLDETWDIKEEWRAPDDEATPKEIQNSLFLMMIFQKKKF